MSRKGVLEGCSLARCVRYYVGTSTSCSEGLVNGVKRSI